MNQSVEVFREHLGSILDGRFTGSLVGRIPAAKAHRHAKKIAVQHVFHSERVLELEAAGYQAIQGLMNIVSNAVLTDSPNGFNAHVRRLTGLQQDEHQSLYEKLLACTDHVSGMTDRHCIALYHRLSGQT